MGNHDIPKSVIPTSEEVKRRLAESRRDTEILRQLLRVAERADIENERRRVARFRKSEG
jgi:hypothetical protein